MASSQDAVIIQPSSVEPKHQPYLQYLLGSADEQDQQLGGLVSFYGTKEESLKQLLKNLYNTLVGGQFHPSKNYIFSNPKTVNMIFAIMPFFEEQAQFELLDNFIILLEECTVDCAMCGDVGLIDKIISIINNDKLSLSSSVIQKLIYMIGILGTQNINAKELKGLLRFMRNKDGSLHQELAPLILEVIRKMARSEAPSSFFNFDGRECGMVADNIVFPTGGYSFCAWIRIERITQQNNYRFFSLLDKKASGLELVFKGNHAVIQVISGRKVIKVSMNHFFHTNRWYFISLVHLKRMFLLGSEISLYVDGELKQSHELSYPSFSSKISFAHFGTNIPFSASSTVSSFCGQSGPIAFFDKSFSAAEIQALFKCGPDFQFMFQKGNMPPHIDLANPDNYGSKLFLLYNPRSCTKTRVCIDNSGKKSPEGNANAKLMQGTTVLISRKVRETFNCIGGVEATFPLFKQLTQEWTFEYSMCARIIALLNEMLRHNKVNQDLILQNHGFKTLGYLLAELPPQNINQDMLKALQGLTEIAARNEFLLKDIYTHVFLNFFLWIRTDIEVQKQMTLFLNDQVAKNAKFFHGFIGMQKILDILRYFYWYTTETSQPDASYQEKERPSETNITIIRYNLMEMMKLMIGSGITDAECVALTRHLLDNPDEKQVIELLRWTLTLIDQEIYSLLDYICDEKFNIPFVTLLHRNTKELRLYALKVIGKMLEKSPMDKRNKFEANGGLLVIEHTLVAHAFDNETYTGIMEIMFNCVNYKINSKIHCDLSLTPIMCPNLLGPFFHLLCDQEMIVREACLKDLNAILKSYSENRRIIARQPNWQNWLLQLIIPKDKEAMVHKSVFELVMDTISTVLAEFMQTKGGYKQLRETLTFMDILSERRDLHLEPLYISLFNFLLPSLMNEMGRADVNKDNPLWENVFHIASFIEEFTLTGEKNNAVFLEQVNIIKYFTIGFDLLLKRSLKEMKAMEILHHQGYKESNTFSLETIQNIVTDLTSNSKNTLPSPSLFVILFRLELFLLKHLDANELSDNKHVIRLLALLCMDIEHSKVPKPQWKGDVTDTDQHTQRLYYILAKLMEEVDRSNYSVVTVLKAVMRKNKSTLAFTLISAEAKEFITKHMTGIEQDAELEEFVLNYKSEWDCIKNSEPFATAYKNAAMESQEMKKAMQARKDKRFAKCIQEIEKYMSRDLALLKKVVADSAKSKTQLCYEELNRLTNWKHLEKRTKLIVLTEWRKNERDMLTGIGVWSTDDPLNTKNKFYVLDPTENSIRMRTRLLFNPKGHRHLEASGHGHDDKKENEDDSSVQTNSELANSIIKPKNNDGEMVGDDESDEEPEKNEVKDIVEDSWETVTNQFDDDLGRERQEDTILKVPCELILHLNGVKGSLEVTYSFVYFIADNEKDQMDHDYKLPVNQIQLLYKRRYLLRYTGLEIFLLNKRTYFFNLEKKDLDIVVSTIAGLKPPLLNKDSYTTNGANLVKRWKLTQLWQKRKISNFEYLMHLNTLSNRTYNDLTQYPVFPWVLKDYESKTIDINDPNVYRDLSKPIGALNPARLQQAIDRYECFMDPVIPKFHYGSHYSSVGTVVYYLLRLEPYTEYNIGMQGGQFDLPDRMFHSLPVTFNNCMTSLADVKELIPEFFYCPEFLKNLNRLDLGKKQNQEILNDVLLPPWAKTPEDFVRINREALESEAVSAHLHEWIDLIFGYKQTGKEAEKAYNIFYYLTYEDSVNIDAITDPLQKRSIETQIQNFGQTPSRLFTKPHPKRDAKPKFDRPSVWKPEPTKPYCVTQIWENSAVVYIKYVSGQIYVINAERDLQIFNYMKSKSAFASVTPIGLPMATDITISGQCFDMTSDSKWLFSCGHFDKSLKSTSVPEKLIVKQSIFNHKDAVTCIMISEEGKYLITGSKDATIDVWAIHRSAASPLTSQPILSLYGHDHSITCLDVSNDLDMVASGDTDGYCIVHTLAEGHYVRTIPYPGKLPACIDLIKICPLVGHVVMHSNKDGMLHLFSCNGALLASVDTKDHLRSMLITPDGKYVVTGGKNKTLVVRRLHDLEELLVFESFQTEIRCLSFYDQYNVICGSAGGKIMYCAIDPEALEFRSRNKVKGDSSVAWSTVDQVMTVQASSPEVNKTLAESNSASKLLKSVPSLFSGTK